MTQQIAIFTVYFNMVNAFHPIYPVSDLLKEHIYCYYTIDSIDDNFKSVHYSFPHTFNAVSIYKGASFSNANGDLSIRGGKDGTPFCVLQGKRQKPLLVDLQGAFSRVTILFKPLGLNHFISGRLDHIIGTDPTFFCTWENETFGNVLRNLFDQNKPEEQINILEEFLKSTYRPFDRPALEKALVLLSDFESDLSIEDVAGAVGLSLRTFNRLFKAHLGVSPVMHQRIARFRHSLENKLFSDKFKKLTDIGYQSNFYDQSYFIKLYDQLAGSNPGALFRKLEQLGDSKLVFEFK